MALMQRGLKRWANLVSKQPHSTPYSSRFFSKSTPYVAKVGIPEFLTGIGNGVESHIAKLESEIGDFQKLLGSCHSHPLAQEAGYSLQTFCLVALLVLGRRLKAKRM